MNQKKSFAALLVLLVVVLATGACAKQVAPPEEMPKGEIVVGIMDDYSGPMAGMCVADGAGRKDAIRYINEKRGGILEHPLRAIVIDHKMDGSFILSGWARLKQEEVPIVMTVTGAAVAILQAASQDDRIPLQAGSGSMKLIFPKEPS